MTAAQCRTLISASTALDGKRPRPSHCGIVDINSSLIRPAPADKELARNLGCLTLFYAVIRKYTKNLGLLLPRNTLSGLFPYYATDLYLAVLQVFLRSIDAARGQVHYMGLG